MEKIPRWTALAQLNHQSRKPWKKLALKWRINAFSHKPKSRSGALERDLFIVVPILSLERLHFLLCYVCLPFGRHHIHRDLFAPWWHKFDCYWHVFCTPYYYVQPHALRPLSLIYQQFNASARDMLTMLPNVYWCVKQKHFENAYYIYIRISGVA